MSRDPTRPDRPAASRRRNVLRHGALLLGLFSLLPATTSFADEVPSETADQAEEIAPAPAGLEAPAERAPNIVILLADDLGWGDVSYHGSEIETPAIDRIAREGLELDRFYVQPTCSPTRTGLMTGKSPARIGIVQPISKLELEGLPLDETILPQHLAQAGYQPLMAGKWHLGHSTPERFPHARGFESFYGHVTGGIGYWDHNHGGGHDWQRDGVTLREEGYSTTLIADEALRLIETRDRERPTFLYVAFNAPHLPNEAPEAAIARYATIERPERRVHAAMVSELDRAIGRIVSALEAEGMLDNSLILFSSDNGGISPGSAPTPIEAIARLAVRFMDRPMPFKTLEFLVANSLDGGSDNGRLKKGKTSLWEGGSRVPAAIWWPGRLEGGRHEGFMTISDVLPTLLEAIGRPDAIPSDLDGRSQWASLRGNPVGSETPDYVVSGIDGEAFYRAPWKLHRSDPPRLFDIYTDPFEENDLASALPDLVESLETAAGPWPRGQATTGTLFESFLDIDTFGGPEDRPPWADVANQRAADAAR